MRIIHVYGAPFWSPKSTQIGPKTSPKLRRFVSAKKMLFKSLLEPSWADLGAFWRPSLGHLSDLGSSWDYLKFIRGAPRVSCRRLEPIRGYFPGHLGFQYGAPVHAGVCLVRDHFLDAARVSKRVLDRTWQNLGAFRDILEGSWSVGRKWGAYRIEGGS